MVGARTDDDNGQNSGSVYIFGHDSTDTTTTPGWKENAKLTASDGTNADLFGHSLALHANVLVVGAPGADNDSGAVYVFVQESSSSGGNNGNWRERVKLAASDRFVNDEFGFSVALDQTSGMVVIGAWEDHVDGVEDAGSSYVFAPVVDAI